MAIATALSPKLSYEEYNRQFEIQCALFEQMRNQLLERYEGKYVAFYEGEVLDLDDDERELAIRIFDTYGYDLPIYIQQVLKDGIPIVDVPGMDID
jgi:hypothetical protein